jgi:hypothetical protein
MIVGDIGVKFSLGVLDSEATLFWMMKMGDENDTI